MRNVQKPLKNWIPSLFQKEARDLTKNAVTQFLLMRSAGGIASCRDSEAKS
jgi:hypothetical protein